MTRCVVYLILLLVASTVPPAFGETEAAKLERELAGATGRKRVETLIQLANELRTHDAPRSLSLAKQAIEEADAAGDPGLQAAALNAAGRTADSLSRFEEAIVYYQLGIEIAEAHGIEKERVSLMHRLGAVYALVGRTDAGLQLCREALQLAESDGDDVGKSQALGQIGVIYMLREEYDLAFEYMTQALRAKRTLKDPYEIAGALSNLGVISRHRGQLHEALDYLNEALEIQQTSGGDRQLGSTLSRIGRVYSDLGDWQKALSFHSQSLALRERAGDRRGIVSSLRDIRDIYRETGKLDKALEYYDRYIQERDAVFDQESKQHIDELQTRFDVETKERENEYLRRTNQLQLYGFLALFALVSGTALFLLMHYRQKASVASLESVLHQLRNAVLGMRSPEDWPQVLASLRAGLNQLDGEMVDCDVFQLEWRDGQPRLLSMSPAAAGFRVTADAAFVRGVLESAEPLIRTGDEVDGRLIEPATKNLAASVALVPLAEGLLLILGRRKSTFRRKRQMLIRVGDVLSGALRRLEDLRTLAARETQLQQAQRMETLGNLTAGIAHHFNNLLQIILGNLEIARNEVSGPATTFLEEVNNAVQRAIQLVSQLLLFSKRTPEVTTEEVDLEKVVEEVCSEVDPRVRLIRDIQAPVRVAGNEKQLARILKNLLDNAGDAVSGQPEPTIRITVSRVNSAAGDNPEEVAPFACLEVADNGVGIDRPNLDRLFDPFFTTRRPEREGLGLSIVLYLTERHGGWVEVESKKGIGTSVRVYLPAATQSSREKEEPFAAA